MPDLPVLGSLAIYLAIPIPPVCVMQGGGGQTSMGWGEPGESLMPVLCPQVSLRPTSWSYSASWLPSCT